MKEIKNW